MLICGSGVGASVAACKIAGIRAAICHDVLLRPPGRRARRHERALPRLRGGGRRACRRARPGIPRRASSTAASATSRRLQKIEEMEKSTWLSHDCTSCRSRARASGSTPSRADLAPRRRARPADGRGRRRRRHVQPDHLPEGAVRGRRLRRPAARAAGDEDDPKEIFFQLAVATSRTPATCSAASGTAPTAATATSRSRSSPASPTTPRGRSSEAQRLHDWVDRPNLYVKIPATQPGLPAIEEMIARGKSINVTLIFWLERYAEVSEAYIRGLERLVERGGDPSTVTSVASFFVSRVDTEADKRLDAIGGTRELRGKLAIANAKLAYEHYQRLLGRALAAARGAGRAPAALPVGVHLDEEPRVPRHDLRRGADRARDRQHDAAGDDRAFQDHGEVARDASTRTSTRPAACSTSSPRPASTTTTSSTRSSARASRSSRLVRRAARRRAGKRGELAPA